MRYTTPANNTILADGYLRYWCPSDALVSAKGVFYGYTVTHNSYRGVSGPWCNPPRGSPERKDYCPNWQSLLSNAMGMIYLGASVSIASVTDGTSNTFLFGEGVYGGLTAADQYCWHWWMAGSYGDTMQSCMWPPNPPDGMGISESPVQRTDESVSTAMPLPTCWRPRAFTLVE